MKGLLRLLLALFLCSWPLQAASPITHMILAKKWMEHVHAFHGKDKDAFLYGNLFPDIRYLGGISRAETHPSGLSLEDIQQAHTPFLAGMHLHAWLDEAREGLVLSWGIYAHVEKYAEGYPATLLKMVEDEILYERISPICEIWQTMHIPKEAFAFGLTKKKILAWHAILCLHFSCRPSTLLAMLAKQNKGYANIPARTVRRWSKVIPYLAEQPQLRTYVLLLEETICDSYIQHL